MKDPQKSEEPLARWAAQVLGQLPPRPAPASLAPRILAVVARQSALPWYRRTWRQWPVGLQVLLGVLWGGAFYALWWLLLPRADAVGTAAASLAHSHLEVVGPLGTLANLAGAIGNAFLLVLRGLGSWVTLGLAATAVLFWSTTLGLGTACWRLAAGTPRRD